jgi:hypothetical protein
MEIDLV